MYFVDFNSFTLIQTPLLIQTWKRKYSDIQILTSDIVPLFAPLILVKRRLIQKQKMRSNQDLPFSEGFWRLPCTWRMEEIEGKMAASRNQTSVFTECFSFYVEILIYFSLLWQEKWEDIWWLFVNCFIVYNPLSWTLLQHLMSPAHEAAMLLSMYHPPSVWVRSIYTRQPSTAQIHLFKKCQIEPDLEIKMCFFPCHNRGRGPSSLRLTSKENRILTRFTECTREFITTKKRKRRAGREERDRLSVVTTWG